MSDARNVVVIGAGVMGHGIAQIAAEAGYTTSLVDVERVRAEAGRAAIASTYDKLVEKGKRTREACDAALARITVDTELHAACRQSQLVIEAVPEDMVLKRRLFEIIAAAAPSDCVLASNTSSLSVTEIAAATPCPERVIGLHFFNPPPLMPLLEVVTGERTSADTLERARAYGAKLGKELVVVRDFPGFASSRLGIALGMEAIRMVETGVASAADIDRAMELGYRHPMGPLKLTDLVGLDTRLKIAQHLYAELGSDTFRPPQLLVRMVRAGKLGKKSGEGFYRWD